MTGEFHLRGRSLRLSSATEEDVEAVARLDEMCFRPHRGSTAEELRAVLANGLIVVVRHGADVVAMTQLVLRRCPLLKLDIPDDEMFSYGTGIHPAWRGAGLADVLMNAQKEIALGRQKRSISSTTRIENASSLGMRFRAGFRLVSFVPGYYPEGGSEGDRALMRWRAHWAPHPLPAYKVVSSVSDVTAAGSGPEAWLIPVSFGDVPDVRAHELVRAAVEAGGVGIGVVKRQAADGRGGLLFALM